MRLSSTRALPSPRPRRRSRCGNTSSVGRGQPRLTRGWSPLPTAGTPGRKWIGSDEQSCFRGECRPDCQVLSAGAASIPRIARPTRSTLGLAFQQLGNGDTACSRGCLGQRNWCFRNGFAFSAAAMAVRVYSTIFIRSRRILQVQRVDFSRNGSAILAGSPVDTLHEPLPQRQLVQGRLLVPHRLEASALGVARNTRSSCCVFFHPASFSWPQSGIT